MKKVLAYIMCGLISILLLPVALVIGPIMFYETVIDKAKETVENGLNEK